MRIGAAVLVLAAVLGQSPQQPTFTGRSDLVLVDVVVTDRQGRPILGLRAADFAVKEDEVVRPILHFEAIERSRRATVTGEPSTPGVPAVAAGLEAASVAVLVDESRLTAGQAAAVQAALRSTVAALSERQATVMLVAPESRVSVAAPLPFSAGRIVAATYQVRGMRVEDRGTFPVADHEAIQIADGDRRVLARVTGRIAALNPDLSESAAETFARTRAAETADAARRRNSATWGVGLLCLDWLADRPGRRHLVIVSSGIAADTTDDRRQALVARSLALNVPVHFVDARRLAGTGRFGDMAFGPALGRDVDEGTSARMDESAGVDGVAVETGGLIVGGTNDLDAAMRRLLDAMGSYYVLAYQPPPGGPSGFRRIEVTTARAGAIVRARSGYDAR